MSVDRCATLQHSYKQKEMQNKTKLNYIGLEVVLNVSLEFIVK